MTATRAMIYGVARTVNPALVLRGPLWTPEQQPYALPELRENDSITQGLVASFYNSAEETIRGPVNLVSDSPGTRTGTTRLPSIGAGPGRLGSLYAPVFAAGSSNAASVPGINFLGSAWASVSFWMWWDAFANDDHLAFEFNDGASATTGFRLNPDSSSVAGFMLLTAFHPTSNLTSNSYARPSAAAWHHYCFSLNCSVSTTTGTNLVPFFNIDGQPQAVNSTVNSGTAQFSLGLSTLYLMSRTATTLFASGRLAYFNMWRRPLSFGEASRLYNDPRVHLRYPQSRGFR
jgi:hypothetical protein